MGIIFNVFTSLALYTSLVLCSLSLTAGLYMLAELAEEFPTLTGKILRYLITFVLIVYFILCIDGLPVKETFIGILCHIAYLSMLSTFPFIELVSLKSFASVVAVIVSNYFWLSYFLNLEEHKDDHFFQIIGFFIVMVWATPIGLLISLTINDNILPGSRPTDYSSKNLDDKRHATIFIAVFNFCSGIVKNVCSFFPTIFGSSFSKRNSSVYGTKKSY